MDNQALILKALEDLHNKFSPIILNPHYRGEMQIYPTFTIKDLQKETNLSSQTLLKYCHKLRKENLIEMKFGKSHFCNDPLTYRIRKLGLSKIQLKKDYLF